MRKRVWVGMNNWSKKKRKMRRKEWDKNANVGIDQEAACTLAQSK